jgi:nucleoside phosphorylase
LNSPAFWYAIGVPEMPPRCTVLVCPLAHEARAIRHHLHLPPYLTPKIVVSGPGAPAVAHALERIAAAHADRAGLLVILAGVAGGLAPVPSVPIIRAVVTEDAVAHPVPFIPHGDDSERRVSLLAIDVPLTTPALKQEWNELTGAALVDTESHALVAAAGRLGLTWSVVRGVSDHYDEALPKQVVRWVGPGGATRPLRVAADLLKKPGLIPEVWRLGRNAGTVLPLVAARVAAIVRAWHGQGLDRA